jgi:hypothetical protein
MSHTYKTKLPTEQSYIQHCNIYSIAMKLLLKVNSNFMVYTHSLSVAQILYAQRQKIRYPMDNKLQIQWKDAVEA